MSWNLADAIFLFYRNGNKIGDVQHADYMKATFKKKKRERKKKNKTKQKETKTNDKNKNNKNKKLLIS